MLPSASWERGRPWSVGNPPGVIPLSSRTGFVVIESWSTEQTLRRTGYRSESKTFTLPVWVPEFRSPAHTFKGGRLSTEEIETGVVLGLRSVKSHQWASGSDSERSCLKRRGTGQLRRQWMFTPGLACVLTLENKNKVEDQLFSPVTTKLPGPHGQEYMKTKPNPEEKPNRKTKRNRKPTESLLYHSSLCFPRSNLRVQEHEQRSP